MKNYLRTGFLLCVLLLLGVSAHAQFFFGLKAGGMYYRPNGNLFAFDSQPGFDIGASFKFRKWDRIAFLFEPGFAIIDGGEEVILDMNNPPVICRTRHKSVYMDTQLKFDLSPEARASFYAGPGIFSIMASEYTCQPDSTLNPTYQLFENLHPYFKLGVEFRVFLNQEEGVPDFRISAGVLYDFQQSILPSGLNFAVKYYFPNKQVQNVHTQDEASP